VSLFGKSSAKTFLKGTAGDASFCDGESLDSPSVRYKKRKTKASFRFPLFVSDWPFFSLAGEGKELQNDLDSATAGVWGAFEAGFWRAPYALLEKFLAVSESLRTSYENVLEFLIDKLDEAAFNAQI